MTHVAVAAAVRVLPRETRHLLSFLVLLTFCSIFFFFVNCARKKKESLRLFFLFHCFRFLFFVGGDINLVNAKLVDTVLNLCTLKCVLLPVQL